MCSCKLILQFLEGKKEKVKVVMFSNSPNIQLLQWQIMILILLLHLGAVRIGSCFHKVCKNSVIYKPGVKICLYSETK